MKVAMIGCAGHWGAALEGIKLHGKSSLVAAAPGGLNENVDAVIERTKKDLGQDCKIYSDYRIMLDTEKPHVVVINPQFYRNGAITLDCLQRQIHTYTEKPIALKESELSAIRTQWQSNPSVQVIAMHELRYLPEFLAGYEWVQSGEMGKPVLFTSQKSYPLLQRPDFFRSRATYGGTIPWIGIHAFDWMTWYAKDRFESVFAQQTTMGNNGHNEMESACTVQLKFRGGALAMSNLDYLRSPKAGTWGDDRIRVAGERGTVEVRAGKAIAFTHDKEPFELPLEPKRSVFLEFLQLVEGKGKMLMDAEECLYSTYVSIKAQQAADESRHITLDR